MDLYAYAMAMTDRNASDFEMTNHKDDSTFNNSITSSCELLDTSIENARNNKKTLASSLEQVISLIREVKLKEKAAEEAKEEAATSGLDVLAKVDELKQAQQQIAKETNEMLSIEVYAKNASLANELKELQDRVSNVVNEGGRFVTVFEEMQKALEVRLTSAIREKELADKEKMEKESLAKESLAFEESQMSKLDEETNRLKQAAMKNSKLQEFLIDRGHVVDKLHEFVSDKCNDLTLLKELLAKPALQLSGLLSSSQPSSTSTVESSATIKETANEHVQFVKQSVLPENALKIPDMKICKFVEA